MLAGAHGETVFMTSTIMMGDQKEVCFMTNEIIEKEDKEEDVSITWRLRERVKTSNVGLVLCLNLGSDPPDVVRTHPCSRQECWIDPVGMSRTKARESIARALEEQYEKLQPNARYRVSVDSTVKDIRKLCVSLRRRAKNDCALLHYNGHGVPRPTANGELWVYNKTYTQYTPLTVYDIMSWIGTPSIFILDCSSAGILVPFLTAPPPAFQGGTEQQQSSSESANYTSCALAACEAGELLPMNPMFPADIFTSCLTTPIMMALRWFIFQNPLPMAGLEQNWVSEIPGKLGNRKTPLGKLNWIFTAITDTIAWNSLPSEMFLRLFRQDLLVASIFRNFLLADRILRGLGCSPISAPRLPPTSEHPLWQTWDSAAESCLQQFSYTYRVCKSGGPQLVMPKTHPALFMNGCDEYFRNQLTAFEVWLDFGRTANPARPPEQLPIVLQVVLSQAHRMRALMLLRRFLDLGPWAVNLALSVGVFPYVVKLLQDHTPELRQHIVGIWTRIMAFDPSCQIDIIEDKAHHHFISHLGTVLHVSPEQSIMAVFILAAVQRRHRAGQAACLKDGLHSLCISILQSHKFKKVPLMQRWIILCIAQLCWGFPEAQAKAMRDMIPSCLYECMESPYQTVRAAAAYGLSSIVSDECGGSEIAHHMPTTSSNAADTEPEPEAVQTEEFRLDSLNIGLSLAKYASDASPLVRREIALALGVLASHSLHLKTFTKVQQGISFKNSDDPAEKDKTSISDDDAKPYTELWEVIKRLKDEECFPGVVKAAADVVKMAGQAAFQMPLGKWTSPHLQEMQSTWHGLYDWSCQFFRDSYEQELADLKEGNCPATGKFSSEPGGAAALDPLSESGTLQLYFTERNRLVLSEAEKLATSNPWLDSSTTSSSCGYVAALSELQVEPDGLPTSEIKTRRLTQTSILDGNRASSNLKFHPFEPILIVADHSNGIQIWDYLNSVDRGGFSNLNPPDNRITTLDWINPDGRSLLMVGSDDGVVRFWDSLLETSSPFPPSPEFKPDLVSAFRACPGFVQMQHGAGLVSLWQQTRGILTIGGNSRKLYQWDLHSEQCVADWKTTSDTCVTSISASTMRSNKFPSEVDTAPGPMVTNTVIAGCGDGTIHLYDSRKNGQIIRSLKGHDSWVLNVHFTGKLGGHEMLSASAAGDIRFWDIRKSGSLSIFNIQHHPMTALAAHNTVPVIASGSNNQFVKVMTTNGQLIDVIQYHDGFLGQRIGPISTLAFHPYLFVLAAGSTDSIVSMYTLPS